MMKKNYFFYLFKYGLTALLLICAIATFAQKSSFSGKVVDENNQPLPGATVHVKGLDQSAATEANGVFHLNNINQTAVTVTVSFVGYDAAEKVINANQPVTIQLHPNAKSLAEIV